MWREFRIGRYTIGSDTLAETFLECLEDSAELRDSPAELTAMRVTCTLYGNGNAAARIASAVLDRWMTVASHPAHPEAEPIDLRSSIFA